jgi:hypothetical protein
MTNFGKYHSRKVRLDGLDFDSQAEAERWAELRLLERAGEIESLQPHPRWVLQPAFTRPDGRRERAITYEADFSYLENGQLVVEDVKPAWQGRKDGAWRVFRLKAKLLLYVHGIDVQVVER